MNVAVSELCKSQESSNASQPCIIPNGIAKARWPDLKSIRVAIFKNAFSDETPFETGLFSILNGIRTGRYTERIAKLREIFPNDLERYRAEKKKLPAFV